jgi:hypothetical protein
MVFISTSNGPGVDIWALWVNMKGGLICNNGLEASDYSYHHLRISFGILRKTTENTRILESKAGI